MEREQSDFAQHYEPNAARPQYFEAEVVQLVNNFMRKLRRFLSTPKTAQQVKNIHAELHELKWILDNSSAGQKQRNLLNAKLETAREILHDVYQDILGPIPVVAMPW